MQVKFLKLADKLEIINQSYILRNFGGLAKCNKISVWFFLC